MPTSDIAFKISKTDPSVTFEKRLEKERFLSLMRILFEEQAYRQFIAAVNEPDEKKQIEALQAMGLLFDKTFLLSLLKEIRELYQDTQPQKTTPTAIPIVLAIILNQVARVVAPAYFKKKDQSNAADNLRQHSDNPLIDSFLTKLCEFAGENANEGETLEQGFDKLLTGIITDQETQQDISQRMEHWYHSEIDTQHLEINAEKSVHVRVNYFLKNHEPVPEAIQKQFADWIIQHNPESDNAAYIDWEAARVQGALPAAPIVTLHDQSEINDEGDVTENKTLIKATDVGVTDEEALNIINSDANTISLAGNACDGKRNPFSQINFQSEDRTDYTVCAILDDADGLLHFRKIKTAVFLKINNELGSNPDARNNALAANCEDITVEEAEQRIDFYGKEMTVQQAIADAFYRLAYFEPGIQAPMYAVTKNDIKPARALGPLSAPPAPDSALGYPQESKRSRFRPIPPLPLRKAPELPLKDVDPPKQNPDVPAQIPYEPIPKPIELEATLIEPPPLGPGRFIIRPDAAPLAPIRAPERNKAEVLVGKPTSPGRPNEDEIVIPELFTAVPPPDVYYVEKKPDQAKSIDIPEPKPISYSEGKVPPLPPDPTDSPFETKDVSPTRYTPKIFFHDNTSPDSLRQPASNNPEDKKPLSAIPEIYRDKLETADLTYPKGITVRDEKIQIKPYSPPVQERAQKRKIDRHAIFKYSTLAAKGSRFKVLMQGEGHLFGQPFPEEKTTADYDADLQSKEHYFAVLNTNGSYDLFYATPGTITIKGKTTWERPGDWTSKRTVEPDKTYSYKVGDSLTFDLDPTNKKNSKAIISIYKVYYDTTDPKNTKYYMLNNENVRVEVKPIIFQNTTPDFNENSFLYCTRNEKGFFLPVTPEQNASLSQTNNLQIHDEGMAFIQTEVEGKPLVLQACTPQILYCDRKKETDSLGIKNGTTPQANQTVNDRITHHAEYQLLKNFVTDVHVFYLNNYPSNSGSPMDDPNYIESTINTFINYQKKGMLDGFSPQFIKQVTEAVIGTVDDFTLKIEKKIELDEKEMQTLNLNLKDARKKEKPDPDEITGLETLIKNKELGIAHARQELTLWKSKKVELPGVSPLATAQRNPESSHTPPAVVKKREAMANTVANTVANKATSSPPTSSTTNSNNNKPPF